MGRKDEDDDDSSSDDSEERTERDKKRRKRDKSKMKKEVSSRSRRSKSEKKKKKERRNSSDNDSESDADDSDSEDRRRKRKRRRREKEEEERRRRRRRKKRSRSRKSKNEKRSRRRSSSDESSSSDDDSDDDSSSSSDSNPQQGKSNTTKNVVNERLLAKLAAKGESLEEWRERRSKKRAAKITAKFGYTAEDNPFNDPNLHETFTWKKKEQKDLQQQQQQPPAPSAAAADAANAGEDKKKGNVKNLDNVIEEIEKVRKRREDRELQFEELERIRAEENRMKELENYDEWQRKEEQFHLNQQKQRSALRLVQGRETPIDILAKNLLMFGNSNGKHGENAAAVKYKEKYSALEELEQLEVELEEPHSLLRALKLQELEQLQKDIHAYITLERQAAASIGGEAAAVTTSETTDGVNALEYWTALQCVTQDEITYLNTGGKNGSHAKLVQDIQQIFRDGEKEQSTSSLEKMKTEIEKKLQNNNYDNRQYWQNVLNQLEVHLAKRKLSDLHSKMLVCQLDKLEQKREQLSNEKQQQNQEQNDEENQEAQRHGPTAKNDDTSFENSNNNSNTNDLEEELGLTTTEANEVDISMNTTYSWKDKYRPRKPRYFNRVKTGYDWNKYNQTHYDHDNPPPKTVQGYKFNVFYPDLIDTSKTPQYFLEPCGTGGNDGMDEFCILRFHAGPPYEDIAFKIINREWNRSRKRGFRCTFERGVLSLYFNFTTHWYRR